MKLKQLMVGMLSFALLSLFDSTLANPAPIATPKTAPVTTNPVTSVAAQNNFSEVQIKQIQKIIHDYLVQNPQVLVEASQVYQDQELAKAKSKTQQAVIKNAKLIFNSPTNSPTAGNLKGDVTVVEFLDYQCTHCKEMSTVVDNLIKSDKNVRIVIKQLPIFGGSSKFAAQAGVAAAKQGPQKFLVFHRVLLELPPPLTNEKVLELAKKSGLDVTQLQNDMKNKQVEDQINENFKLAQDLGLLGTPAFIIGNRDAKRVEYVPGAVTVDSLKTTISTVRK